ncbi:M12 family metallopeptidase [Fibrella aquatica]|uniref:M12 family metallopeptidase n=1 Tax=Fibrella aquatica TaxID=3242487 RepID=UPI003521D927
MKNVHFSMAGTALAVLCLFSCSTDQQQTDLAPTQARYPVETAYPLQAGTLKKATFRGEPVTYRLINGEAVFQGDIILPANELADPERTTEGTGRTLKSLRWAGKIVYYTINPNLPDQARVTDAIAHWEANTPIRFVPRTTQYNYVTFQPGAGCSAYVGRVGGQQFITLSSWCTTGNTIHEIGHTVGLYHEHSRADRDNSVTVLTQNIMPGYENDFKTYVQMNRDGFDHVGGFDFNSVMLYNSWGFSANGEPTLVKKDGSTFTAQRDYLSPLDIATVQTMYP